MNENETLIEIIKYDPIESSEYVYKIPIKSNNTFNLDQYDSLSTTLAYLDKTYCNSIWKSTQGNCYHEPTKYVTTDFKTCLTSLVQSLYGSTYLNNQNLDTSSHLIDLKNFNVTNTEFKLEYSIKNLFNLHEILLYSPRVLDSHEKILFILYQLIKFIKKLNNLNLNLNELKLSDIYMDQNYWLRLKLPIESILNTYKTSLNRQFVTLVNDSFFITHQLNELYDSYKHLTNSDLANLTKNWCFNRISNFDYLLILNCLAGKRLNCAFNHPIFPWITDFTTKNGNLRDLTQSKFRLNKGDAHLDLTYQASSSTGSYHLTEFLSEISYFVYKSRVTDKETLCKHVRRTWVPNEYPASMNRLYLWTPEECIPEFYYDINIFKSIHDDMPDLKLPEWANESPEEFIRVHRLLLESEQVSKDLHNWIDLVFGYKLSGEAAVEAKNVCLPLIDNHQTIKTYGIVQLFNTPHPVRCIDKTFHGEKAPIVKNMFRNKTGLKSRVQSVTSMENELKKKSTVKTDELSSSGITLPDEYNPLEKIEQVESMLKFINKAYHCLPDDDFKKEVKNEITFEQLALKDLKCIACILCELIMFNKLKCLPQNNSIDTRYAFICKTIIQEPHIITGPFQPFILSVLKPFGDQSSLEQKSPPPITKTSKRMSFYMENIYKYQSENVNVSKLLNPHLTILPFKLYFENLYKFNEIVYKLDYLINEYKHLEKCFILKQLNLIITQTGLLNMNRNVEDVNFYTSDETPSLDQTINIDLLYEQKFYLALLYLPKLMYDMSDPKKNFLSQSICVGNESYELILQYLVHLFENPNTCVNSFLFLSNKLTKFLSKQELVKRVLPALLCVLNIVDLNETVGIDFTKDDDKIKFCKLFDYTFINELRIIFGLEIFLTQIFPFLIEAISGFKDFEFESTELRNDNISSTAFNSFQRIIPTLGPVLTCKYCCNDLFKMLAICYMNQKCLFQVENSDNPLNSCRAIEGDRFAYLILESLKTVAMFYGEQVIVVQYLPNVSNTVNACASRLSIRLEASLLAGIVLVNFFISYLDIKLLMDELTYIINQILIPVIHIYSNVKVKFPNGYLMRQALAYKTLDILLLLSLRIGPEQTRILMEQVLRAFFNSFSQVRSNIMNPGVYSTKPVRIETDKSTTRVSFIRPRTSLMSFNQRNKQESFLMSHETKDVLSEELNSFDEYLKFSYDPTTNEIIDSPLGKRLALSSSGPKYRAQSFGLLSLNNEEDSDQFNSPANSPRDNSIIALDDEMVNTFNNELAHTAYLSISRLTSGNYIDGILSNGDLIHRMCLLDEQANKKNSKPDRRSKEDFESRSVTGINIINASSIQRSKFSSSALQSTSYGSSFSEHVGISGNQIQINSDDLSPSQEDPDLSFINSKFTLKFSEKDLKEQKSKLDNSRHLSENWLAYWENEIRSNNKGNQFDFKHINLLTLSGHSSAVRCLHSLDNESSFISGSKDKTVKLWSLKLHGANKKNQQQCQWTYTQHKKQVNGLLFIESLRVCVSCDGSVHVWNPFAGRKLFQFDNQIVTCMSNLPSPSSSFVVATADNYVKFVDLRTKSFAYELRTCYAPSGSIKSISASDNLLLVGFSTGLMSLLDMRTGWIQESCKTLDNEILQLKFYSNDKFICSYSDGSIAISTIRDKVQVQNMIKVYNEPVPFLSVNQTQLITATGSNKIGIHSNIDRVNQMTYSVNKLQQDTLKGVITSQTYLPLNRLLLVGSDSGDIKLIC